MIEPRRFHPALRRVFPNLVFLDPHQWPGHHNPICIAGGVAGTATVFVRERDRRGRLVSVPPARLTGFSPPSVGTWVNLMFDVYADLGLPLPAEVLTHHVFFLMCAGRLTKADAARVQRVVAKHHRLRSK
jgi:hypothetical protein